MISPEKHVEEELIAYLDGELTNTDQARIQAHLRECASCRTALAELHALRQDIGATLDHALTPVRLSREADARIRRKLQTQHTHHPAWWQVLWQRRGLFSQVVMAVFLVFVSVTTLRAMTPSVPVPIHETIVIGQDRFAPGSQGALRVVVQSLGSALPSAVPVPGAEVVVNLARASGVIQKLYAGQTDATGSADITFVLPDNVEGEAEFVVETTSIAGTERLVRPIHIERSHRIYLGSDKPTYRPGQILYLRALVLDAVSGMPATEAFLTFQVIDKNDLIVFEQDVSLSDYGIGFAEYLIPENAPIGPYTIRAEVGEMAVERLVEVNLYPPPAFSIVVETEETYVMPGDRIHGTVACSYFFGKPVLGAVRIIAMSGENIPIVEETGFLDMEGVYRFQIDVPDGIEGNAITIVASVLDSAGQIEGIQHPLPLSIFPLLIKAVPESGRLKSGVENIIYLTTVYPDGRPAQTGLDLKIDGQQTHLRTDVYGMALFRFTPRASTDLTVVARDADGRVTEEIITLVADADARSLLLRVDRAAYKVGETLTLEALVAADDVAIVYLDVIRSWQTVAVLSAPVVNHRAVFALDLDANLSGALNLHAYGLKDSSVILEDSRLVVVDPAGSLDISVSSDQQSYKPGETAHLQVTTALEDQDDTRIPVQSALGIAVVDTSVLSLDRLPPGFARTYFLMESDLIDRQGVIPGYDPLALLEGAETIRQAQDMAARAAWAGVENVAYTVPSSVRMEGIDEGAMQRTKLARSLSWLLILLPLGFCMVVVDGLLPSGVLWRACRRLGWGMLAITVLSPLLIAGLFLGMLLPWLGTGLAIGLLLVVAVLIIGLLILSWVHHDTRLQLAVVLVGTYISIAICILILVAMAVSAVLEEAVVAIVTGSFLLLLISLYVLAQGLILEGRRLDGWLMCLLVLLLILLTVSIPSVPQLRSNLSQTISNPLLYSGPVGWMTGCMAATSAPEAVKTEEPTTVIKEVEATEITAATPSPLPTATLQPLGTATPVLIPAEAYPLRQLFPETLYWAPELKTGEDGTLNMGIQMADSLTTWRLTALGSTKNGDIGATTYDLRVFQDFFVDVTLPEAIKLNQTVSVTLTIYNYLDTAQTVRWEIVPSSDYLIQTTPQALTVDANDVASTTFSLIPQRTGVVVLQVKAMGDAMVDTVRLEMDVIRP